MAAFDFDGTLVPGDSLQLFLAALLGWSRMCAVLVRASPGMAGGYALGGRDRAKTALLHHAVRGLDAASVAAAGHDFGRKLAERVRPDLRGRIEWHRGQGHRLVLVSASLTVYLEPFAIAMKLDDVIASRLEVNESGRLTGRLLGPNVRGPVKAARLRALIGPDPVELWAYGDSRGDREMLAMADHPTHVRSEALPELP